MAWADGVKFSKDQTVDGYSSRPICGADTIFFLSYPVDPKSPLRPAIVVCEAVVKSYPSLWKTDCKNVQKKVNNYVSDKDIFNIAAGIYMNSYTFMKIFILHVRKLTIKRHIREFSQGITSSKILDRPYYTTENGAKTGGWGYGAIKTRHLKKKAARLGLCQRR